MTNDIVRIEPLGKLPQAPRLPHWALPPLLQPTTPLSDREIATIGKVLSQQHPKLPLDQQRPANNIIQQAKRWPEEDHEHRQKFWPLIRHTLKQLHAAREAVR